MAQSALNLRLVLAAAGFVICLVLGVFALRAFGLLLALPLFVLALAAVVDLAVVQRRRRARARAHLGQDHKHDSLFE
jgi:membrane protein implicated in regulation of membrane protease activity